MKPDATMIEEYRRAWTEFERTVRQYQAARGAELEASFIALESARLKYSAARDRLVARILEADLAHLAPVSEESRIRSSARLLWELSGQPEHSAECDWLRAEALVRGAS